MKYGSKFIRVCAFASGLAMAATGAFAGSVRQLPEAYPNARTCQMCQPQDGARIDQYRATDIAQRPGLTPIAARPHQPLPAPPAAAARQAVTTILILLSNP